MSNNELIKYDDGKVRYKDIVIADKGFVLNLPDRLDRRESVIKVLNELQITGWEFEDGVRLDELEWKRYGCTQSYINMFKKAIDNDYDSIIVFEDDIKKTGMISFDQIDKIFKQWPEQSKNYSFIALGTRPLPNSKVIKESDNFGVITSCLCTQSFYFNREFIKYAYEKLSCYKDPLCSHFKVVIDEFISDCCSHENPLKLPNQIFKGGITIPMMFTQAPSYSDNEQEFMNFEGWIEDSYWAALSNGERKDILTDSKDLLKIGIEHQTDKVSHGFLTYYETLLGHLRNEKINFLEIGVFYGSSIKMWRDYYTNGNIYGMDTFEGIQGNGMTFDNPASFYDYWKTGNLDRVQLFKCDQSKKSELNEFVEYCDKKNILFDVILDDGSHMMRDQQITLSKLFKLVKSGGYFIVEDIHSSDYYPAYDVESDFSNTTKNVLLNFKNTKKLKSPYIKSEKKIKYLESSMGEIEHFTSLNNQSQVIVIKKK